VVYARRLEVTAEFPETDFGDISAGGSNLILQLAYDDDGDVFSAGTQGLVACRSNHVASSDQYGQSGNWGKWLFDLMPGTPDANVTVFVPVPRTPNNPDAQLPEDTRPLLGAVVGAHSSPDTVQDGITAGRADIFEDYTKFGAFGDLNMSGEFFGSITVGPEGGTFE
jgi:hypothetical protein